jgi:hypothetical protein
MMSPYASRITGVTLDVGAVPATRHRPDHARPLTARHPSAAAPGFNRLRTERSLRTVVAKQKVLALAVQIGGYARGYQRGLVHAR